MAFISIALDAFTSGSFLAEGDYRWQNARFHEWDYDGKIENGKTAVVFEAELVPWDVTRNAATGAESAIQRWSVGDPANLAPTEDGRHLEPRNKQAMSTSCNYYLLVKSMVDAGLSPDVLVNAEGACDFINGAITHIAMFPAPKRDNLPKSNVLGDVGQQRERTIPLITIWHVKPGTTQAAATAAPAQAAAKPAATPKPQAAAPAPAATASSTAGGDVTELLTEHLMTALSDVDTNGKDRTQVRVKVFQAMNKAKVPAASRDASMGLFANDGELGNILMNMGYVLDGKLIKQVG